MNYNDEINEVNKLIKDKKYSEAESKLLSIISSIKDIEVEEENCTHYSIKNYIELLLFVNIFRPTKENKELDLDVSQIYCYLGFVNIKMENYEKAIEYYNIGLKWNPVSCLLMFEKATAYRLKGDLDTYKTEIEKVYPFIYNVDYMSRYYCELGWYYAEKRSFDISNALYTYSLNFLNTEFALNELKFIANQEKRNIRYSIKDEIQKIFQDNNIQGDFYKTTVEIISTEFQRLLKEKLDSKVIVYLSRTLYDITLDKKYILYIKLNDKKYGIEIIIPEMWKELDKKDYSKLGLDQNTVFAFLALQNINVNVICNGECSEEQFDEVYNLNIENMKKQGIEIVKEYTFRNIKQVFIDVKNENSSKKLFQNYLVRNGYLFNVSWIVPSNADPDSIIENLRKSMAMNVVFSLRRINSGEVEATKELKDIK